VAAARGVDLAFAGEPAQVRGDPALLRLICANLLDNAVRHAPPKSEVEVRITPAEGGAELRVTDHGPGIAPADRRKVLQRFYRGTDASGPGVGLGLAIVSEAIRLVGGRLELLGRADGASGLQAKVAFSAVPKASA
jgi:signal transduction histidine kinase